MNTDMRANAWRYERGRFHAAMGTILSIGSDKYFERIEEFPVLSQIEPGWLKEMCCISTRSGEDFGEVLGDVERFILPAVTHWNHRIFTVFFLLRPAVSAYRRVL
jgi:hypothetical protein